ncbi:Ig-like domain repeat protein [Granulicella sp. S156]|uniref:Ig-like domain repeat protein n=1 Tax=Granulicella sp. S156 TaxID=1747224 RepID=UPI00131CCEB1|nr:Ig-like domain repeat protein [Granulicella sp. S156]
MPEYSVGRRLSLSLMIVLLLVGNSLALFSAQAHAQAAPMVKEQVSDSKLVTLKNNVHPLAKAEYDQGAVPESTPTGGLLLTLKRPVQQQATLRNYLVSAHTKGSANFHKWLTPAQFGERFGPAESDIAAVMTWLESHGFQVEKIGAGRSAIEFSGTAGNVKEAFHTELHAYLVNGQLHHSNVTNPQIPEALSPVIAGIGALNDFHPQSEMESLGNATMNLSTHKVVPQWTTPNGNGGTDYIVAPEDFATQYDLTPLYMEGITGAGQRIGILNDSNIDIGQVSAYRKLYNLDGSSTPNLPQTIIDGDDPGINGDSGEAYLDVELAGAVAPQASIDLYIAANTDYANGLDLAILRAIEDDRDPVLSLSFGGCEAAYGASTLAFYNAAWEQAAAQGQTVLVATGDSGSAGCDSSNSYMAEYGLQVNGLASTPWNVAVGGTDFYYSDYATGGASASQYWASTNDNNLGSLTKPLPEQVWNNNIYGLNTSGYDFPDVIGGGGGQSTCADPNGPLAGQNPLTAIGYCQKLGGYAKPDWQAGTGVPNDQVRDLPDVALFASNGANNSFYAICAGPQQCIPSDGSVSFSGVGGTSASTPAFAAIMALVNQKYGPQGQADYVLYPLAKQVPTAFHDVTVGSNNEPCDGTLTFEQYDFNCSADATVGNFSLQNWYAAAGYDMGSGLGSVDADVLVTNWNKVTFTPTTLTFSATPTSIAHGQKVTLTAYVGASSGSETPTGVVAVIADTPLTANKSQLTIPLNSTGTGATTVNYLPGGTYNLYGQYTGDGTFGGATSTPISLTVTPENSALSIVSNVGGTSPVTPVQSGASIPYGTTISLSIQPIGVNAAKGQSDGIATGTVTVTDNGNPLSTIALDSTGAAFFTSAALAIGSHSFTVSYSGDASFSASSSASPITFSVAKGATTTYLDSSTASYFTQGYPFYGYIFVQGSYPTGATGGGAPPTGSVVTTLSNSTQTLVETVQLSPLAASGAAYGIATYDQLPVGTYNLTTTYSGDSNWAGSTSTIKNYVDVVAPTTPQMLTTTTLAITSPTNPQDIQPGTPVTVVATTAGPTGASVAPTGYFGFLSAGSQEELCVRVGTPATSGATITATCTYTATNAYPNTQTVFAEYLGDQNYIGSMSSILSYSNPSGDFTLTAQNQSVVVQAGTPASAAVLLASSTSNPYTGSVSLTCSVAGGPSGNTVLPTCSVPGSVTLSASGQSTATVQLTSSFPPASSSTSGATANTAKNGVNPLSRYLAGGNWALALVLLIGIPVRKRAWKAMLMVALLLFVPAMIMGCGGGSKSTPPPPSATLVPAGNYTVVVTGMNGLVTHNVQINLTVQ